MGRNRKVGLDWWPRDIGLYRDPKLRAARQKFGVLGPYVYECLLDIAYGDKGYYIAYSGEAAVRCGIARVHRRTGKRDDRNTGRRSRSAGGKRPVPCCVI
ncbi:MAG: Lin1244/Lin1753 domain-containing protein [Butyricicoccus sp.]